MKRSKFTGSQITDSLERAESGLAVPEISREPGISTATFYSRRGEYGGMGVSPMAQKGAEAKSASAAQDVRRRGDRARNRRVGVGKE